MCAIIGSSRQSMFEVLFEANKDRGQFGTGIMQLCNGNQVTDLFDCSIEADDFEEIYKEHADYYMCHMQAPTSSSREWSPSNAHPFIEGSWAVMHNGVLTNAEGLRDKYYIDPNGIVDTSVIPALLQYNLDDILKSDEYVHDSKAIINTLNDLEGTFALCIVDTDTNKVWLARQGSTLFYNDKGDFSSVEGKGYKEVPEGVLLCATTPGYEEFHPIEEFKTTSPFLFV